MKEIVIRCGDVRVLGFGQAWTGGNHSNLISYIEIEAPGLDRDRFNIHDLDREQLEVDRDESGWDFIRAGKFELVLREVKP